MIFALIVQRQLGTLNMRVQIPLIQSWAFLMSISYHNSTRTIITFFASEIVRIVCDDASWKLISVVDASVVQ